MVERAVWNSRTGFLLAALGSAIGLGNIWRFPYMAYRNGGGAFLIPYLVALFVVGIPLLMLEFGLGHYFRRAFPQSLKKIDPRFSWIGWWSVSFVMFGIVVYYGVVIAWCANYLLFAVTQPWGTVEGVDVFFDETFLGAVVDGQAFDFYDEDSLGPFAIRFGAMQWSVLVALGLVWLVNWMITRRQLQHGIELANKIFIPILIVLTTVMVIWSWNFDGAAAGRAVYLTPDWSLVLQPQTWIDAFGQIFFTLSIGFGIMVAYASYLPDKSDIPTSAFLAAVGNCVFSIFAAFAVFSAVGMLANQRNIDLSQIRVVEQEVAKLEALKQSDPVAFAAEQDRYQQLVQRNAENQQFQSGMRTFGLLFKTYPAILTEMGPVTGRLFGVLFFFFDPDCGRLLVHFDRRSVPGRTVRSIRVVSRTDGSDSVSDRLCAWVGVLHASRFIHSRSRRSLHHHVRLGVGRNLRGADHRLDLSGTPTARAHGPAPRRAAWQDLQHADADSDHRDADDDLVGNGSIGGCSDCRGHRAVGAVGGCRDLVDRTTLARF